MLPVIAFGCHVQYIGRIYFLSPYPVADVFAKPASDFRVVTLFIGCAQIFKPLLRPFADWHHDLILYIMKCLDFVKCKQPLPVIRKRLGHFLSDCFSCARDTLGPEPAEFTHFENEFNDVGVSFPIDYPFFDIQYK